MGGQKFQYDESGGTFFYFLLSFLALLLVPGTYYWWPRKQKQGIVSLWLTVLLYVYRNKNVGKRRCCGHIKIIGFF